MLIDLVQASDPFWVYRSVILHGPTPASSHPDSILITTPVLSLAESNDPLNLSHWMDPAPLTLSIHSPMELILEVFIKLGVRMVSVTDSGRFVGVIHKKRLLAFVSARKRGIGM